MSPAGGNQSVEYPMTLSIIALFFHSRHLLTYHPRPLFTGFNNATVTGSTSGKLAIKDAHRVLPISLLAASSLEPNHLGQSAEMDRGWYLLCTWSFCRLASIPNQMIVWLPKKLLQKTFNHAFSPRRGGPITGSFKNGICSPPPNFCSFFEHQRRLSQRLTHPVESS